MDLCFNQWSFKQCILNKRKMTLLPNQRLNRILYQLGNGVQSHTDLSIDHFHSLPLCLFSCTQKEFVYIFIMLTLQQQRKVLLQSSISSSWEWADYRVSKDHRRYLLFVILNCVWLQSNHQRSPMCEEDQGSTVRPDLFEFPFSSA
jgi:hypothetical protein